MKILICGVGAIGSNLAAILVPDLRGQHEITILDYDTVEERNVTPGTQCYTRDQIGQLKVEALQFNLYHWFEREVGIIQTKVETVDPRPQEAEKDGYLMIDCFDNAQGRKLLQEGWKKTAGKVDFSLLHVGFSDQFTFAVEWAEHYQVPSDITSGLDICEMSGAAAFVKSVASVAAAVVEHYVENGQRLEIVGGQFHLIKMSPTP